MPFEYTHSIPDTPIRINGPSKGFRQEIDPKTGFVSDERIPDLDVWVEMGTLKREELKSAKPVRKTPDEDDESA